MEDMIEPPRDWARQHRVPMREVVFVWPPSGSAPDRYQEAVARAFRRTTTALMRDTLAWLDAHPEATAGQIVLFRQDSEWDVWMGAALVPFWMNAATARPQGDTPEET